MFHIWFLDITCCYTQWLFVEDMSWMTVLLAVSSLVRAKQQISQHSLSPTRWWQVKVSARPECLSALLWLSTHPRTWPQCLLSYCTSCNSDKQPVRQIIYLKKRWKITHPILQWAAVSTQDLWTRDPPQKCWPFELCNDTMYLIEFGAGVYPPTMRPWTKSRPGKHYKKHLKHLRTQGNNERSMK